MDIGVSLKKSLMKYILIAGVPRRVYTEDRRESSTTTRYNYITDALHVFRKVHCAGFWGNLRDPIWTLGLQSRSCANGRPSKARHKEPSLNWAHGTEPNHVNQYAIFDPSRLLFTLVALLPVYGVSPAATWRADGCQFFPKPSRIVLDCVVLFLGVLGDLPSYRQDG